MQHPFTFAGHQMDAFVGHPADVTRLGTQMADVGSTMQQAASTLNKLATAQDGMQGYAIDQVRKEVGESHIVLERAGNQYHGVGEALKQYGLTMESLEPQFKREVQDAEDAWNIYLSLPGDKDGRSYGLFGSAPEPGSPEEAADAREDAAKATAYLEWKGHADAFDRLYEDWESAWDTATNDVRDEFNDDLKDGFWDKVDAFVEGLQSVLAFAGIVVGILAIVFGGPILALIGSIIAVATLVLTVYQMFRGDAGLFDLGVAVLGIVPFGSLGKLADGFDGLKAFGKDLIPKAVSPTAWSAAKNQFRDLSIIKNFSSGRMRAGWDVARGAFHQGNPAGFKDVLLRNFTGKTVEDWGKALNPLEAVGNFGWLKGAADIFSPVHSLIGGYLKFDSQLSKICGTDSMKSKSTFVKVFF